VAGLRHGGTWLIFGGPNTVAVAVRNWQHPRAACDPLGGPKGGFQRPFWGTYPILKAAAVHL